MNGNFSRRKSLQKAKEIKKENEKMPIKNDKIKLIRQLTFNKNNTEKLSDRMVTDSEIEEPEEFKESESKKYD